ncbi:sel1 repeat family protein [Neisseria sicca]|uniref:sel1 repeat family protein n=1 Tax=Neisseria sicca TaxID=490 RepID=UPI0028801271|nr:sel1 repeat family protein [Neisseria sicca]
MMDVNGLIDESIKLFNEKQYDEAIEILHQAWDEITDKNTQVIEQMFIQAWLGRCYFAQAEKTKDTDKADEPFKLAVEHYRQRLKLAKQLPEEQASISICEQIDVQVWLGHHYLTYAKRTKYVDKASELFEQSVEHYEKWLQLTEQLENKQDCIWQQTAAQSWLVHCYAEQARKTKNTGEINDLFGRAIKHNEKRLQLAEQLGDKQDDSIKEQIDALSWFCGCYLEQAIKTKDMNEAAKLFSQANAFAKRNLRLTRQLENEQIRIQQQIFARFGLSRCYIERVKRIKNTDKAEALFKKQANKYLLAADEQLSLLSDETKKTKTAKQIRQSLRDVAYLNENWHSYFEKKKQEIQESLFKGKTSQLQDAVSTILAVLHIPPIELGFTPMAHYTSPHVCHILFGIGGNETASPMRLGSSTYMNDPSEGKSLLDLLNQQDLELENKADGASHNAFFTCFSSRVNDLNQFRLYGKEDGVEASGCCLVFNKNGDWLREADVSVPFRSLSEKSGQDSDDLPEDGFWNDEYEKLPLYQVAYIAYKDEYIAEKKCGIWLLPQEKLKFGIRLKPVGNEEWHQFRLEKLKEALEELIEFFKDNSAVSDDDKEALEYIRYLFKDFAFRDEEEFRLLVIKPIDSEEIEYCETTQSVYIPYADIRNLADEVILGTNYEKTGNQRKAEVFRYQMKQKCPDVKVSRSTLPINPPNK